MVNKIIKLYNIVDESDKNYQKYVKNQIDLSKVYIKINGKKYKTKIETININKEQK